MKRKIMSTVLAILMIVSSVPISSLPVFATNKDSDVKISKTKSSDDIQVKDSNDGIAITDGKSKDDSDIKIDSSGKSSSDDITVTESKTDAADTADVQIEDALAASATYQSEKKELNTGDVAKVHVKAENKSEQAATLKLYFCNTDEKLAENKTEWSGYLQNPALEMSIKDLKKDCTLEVPVVDKDKNETKSSLKFLKEIKDNKVLSRYAVVTLPAGASTEFDVSVTDNKAGTVSVIPVMEQTGTEFGDAATLTWSEDITFIDKVVNFFTKSADIQISDVQGVEKGLDDVSDSDFVSNRLVVMTDKDDMFTDKDSVIGHYGNIYLLQYDSVANTKEAYARLKDKVTAVEPDKEVTAASNEVTATLLTNTESEASDNKQTEDITVSDNNDNAIAGLNDMKDSKKVQKEKGVIALIDTGTSESDNVIARVSMIDDALEGNGHGDAMLRYIVSQDADAKVLSIRALGNDGLGTVSDLVAAMEYAIDQKVDYINLSLYTKATLATSVLEQEIAKATDAGIVVIGAAGNDGADVKDYIPGSVESAYVIGSAKDDGTRQEKSNFGSTVDYNVKATTTSEATALFTGYISANGLDKVSDILNKGMIYATDYKGDDIKVEEPDYSDVADEDCNINVAVTDNASGKVTQYELTDKDNYTLTWDATASHVTAQTSSEQWMITDVSVKDSDGNDVVKPEVQDNIRNVFFDMDATGKVTMKFSVKQNKAGVPILDESSGVIYYESLLCGDNCLEDHVRHPETGDYVDTEEHIDLENMTESEEKVVKAAAYGNVNDGGKVPSGTYSGTATCTFNGVHGAHRSGPCTITFTSGLLNGFSISNFRCNRHGSANPGVGGPSHGGGRGTYTATVVSAANGIVRFNFHYMPYDYASNYQDEKKDNCDFTYTYVPPITYTWLSITKSWDDQNNKFGIRPQSVIVELIKDGRATGQTKALTAGNNWSARWDGLEYTNAGVTHSYNIVEHSVAGYTNGTINWSGSYAGGWTGTVTNKVNLGYLKLHKSSSLPKITDGNPCYNLAGAVYKVYTDPACTQEATHNGDLITNENGDTGTVALKPGNYWVKETKTTDDDHYYLNNTVYPVTVTEGNTTNSPVKLSVEDEPGNDPAGISITKIWNGEKTATVPPLTGTQFTVCYYAGKYDKSNLPSTPTRKWVLKVKPNKKGDKYITGLDDYYLVPGESDELYKDEDDLVLLPFGTYTIQETKEAPGYTLEGSFTDQYGHTITPKELYVTQVLKKGDAIELQGGNVYASEDSPKPSKITLKKFDTDGKTPYAGAKFELKNAKGEVVDTKTTGKDGVIEFTDLYPDIYTITELETKDRHTLLKEPITVKCPMTVTDEDIKKYGIDKSQCIYDEDQKVYYIFNQTYNVTNDASFEVPMTGGVFTPKMLIPLAVGLVIMTGALFISLRKKRSI